MKKVKGFTLIELLVVIAIIGILSGVVFINFRLGEEKYALQRSAYKLAHDIRRAQEIAMSAKEFGGVGVPQGGYGLYFNPVELPHHYGLFADDGDCIFQGAWDPCEGECVELICLESGVRVESANNSSITFAPPDPKICILPSGDKINVTLSLETDSSKIKTISVNKVGLISISDVLIKCSSDADCEDRPCATDWCENPGQPNSECRHEPLPDGTDCGDCLTCAAGECTPYLCEGIETSCECIADICIDCSDHYGGDCGYETCNSNEKPSWSCSGGNCEYTCNVDSGCGGGSKSNGESCEVDSECQSEHCVDGYCCDETCDGTCQTCADPFHLGTCTTRLLNDDTECSTCYRCNGVNTSCQLVPDRHEGKDCTAVCRECDGLGSCVDITCNEDSVGNNRCYDASGAQVCDDVGSCVGKADDGALCTVGGCTACYPTGSCILCASNYCTPNEMCGSESPPPPPSPSPSPPIVTNEGGAGDGKKWTLATANAQWASRWDHTALVYNYQMWVMGGYPYRNDVWYSFDGISWTQETANAQWGGRKNHTSVVYGGKMWVIGGYDKRNDVWSSSNGVSWNQATQNAQWEGRYSHSSLVYPLASSKMWVMGGWGIDLLDDHLNDVWSSLDGMSWVQETANAQWGSRTDHTSVVYNDKMWVIGGLQGSTYFNDVWSSSDGKSWTRATQYAQWKVRESHTSLVYDSKMWVMGGHGEGQGVLLNDVWYSTDGIIWTQAAANAPWSARNGLTSLAYNSRLWVIGGGTNDVWYSVGSGATNISKTSATLNGYVADTGGENPNVYIYWGATDGGTNPSNWYTSVDLGLRSQSEFFNTNISGLSPGTTYFYRCFAWNSGGSDWADETASFTTWSTAETIRPTGFDDVRGKTSDEGYAYDEDPNTGSYTLYGYGYAPSCSFGTTWQTKNYPWSSAKLYVKIQREATTGGDKAAVEVYDSGGTFKHTVLPLDGTAYDGTVQVDLNASNWGGAGFPNISNLRVNISDTKSGASDGKKVYIYDIRIEGTVQ